MTLLKSDFRNDLSDDLDQDLNSWNHQKNI